MKQLKLFEVSAAQEVCAFKQLDQKTREKLLALMTRILVTMHVNQQQGGTNDAGARDEDNRSTSES